MRVRLVRKVRKTRNFFKMSPSRSIMKFKKILKEHGYSEKAIAAILKWYRRSVKAKVQLEED